MSERSSTLYMTERPSLKSLGAVLSGCPRLGALSSRKSLRVKSTVVGEKKVSFEQLILVRTINVM